MEIIKVTRQRKYTRITEELKNLIVIDYNNGMTQRAIAEKHHISQPAVSLVIKERRELYG